MSGRLKFIKECYIGSVVVNSNPFKIYEYDHKLTSKYNTNIIVSKDVVRSNSLIFGLVDVNGNIWVDDYFINSTSNLQNFIINHEIGHIKCGHLNNSNNKKDLLYSLKRSLTRNFDNIEFEADLYSAKIIGKKMAILALEEMAHNKLISKREIKRRIKNIQDNF